MKWNKAFECRFHVEVLVPQSGFIPHRVSNLFFGTFVWYGWNIDKVWRTTITHSLTDLFTLHRSDWKVARYTLSNRLQNINTPYNRLQNNINKTTLQTKQQLHITPETQCQWVMDTIHDGYIMTLFPRREEWGTDPSCYLPTTYVINHYSSVSFLWQSKFWQVHWIAYHNLTFPNSQ